MITIRPITGKRLSEELFQCFQNLMLEQLRTGREPRGSFRWEGVGAQRLGLSGAVDRPAILNLVNGFSADGKVRLTADAGSQYRVGGAEILIAAPMALNAAWALSPRKISDRLEKAHWQSDQAGMAFLNQRIFDLKEPGKVGGPQLVFAVSRENVSDCQNPHLVSRFVLLTHTRDVRGAEHKASSEKLLGHARLLDKVYQGTLARSLSSDFGIPVERENGELRISGIPNKVLQEFSPKEGVVSTQYHSDREIIKSWETRGKAIGWGPEEAAAFMEYHEDFRDRCRQELKNERDPRSGAAWFGHEREQDQSQGKSKDSESSHSHSH